MQAVATLGTSNSCLITNGRVLLNSESAEWEQVKVEWTQGGGGCLCTLCWCVQGPGTEPPCCHLYNGNILFIVPPSSASGPIHHRQVPSGRLPKAMPCHDLRECHQWGRNVSHTMPLTLMFLGEWDSCTLASPKGWQQQPSPIGVLFMLQLPMRLSVSGR